MRNEQFDTDSGQPEALSSGQLTPRERRVLQLASEGRTNKQIAADLGISKNAVRYHLKELHSKLETGGDRDELRGGRWRRLVHAFFALSLGKAGTAVSFGLVGVTLAAAGVGAYVTFPSTRGDLQTPVAVDGIFPNGCPDHYNPSGAQTVGEFAAMLRLDPATILALNPGLDSGPLAQDASIAVPYQPNTTCSSATLTPPGTTPVSRGTPQGPTRDSPAHAEVTVTPPAR